MNGFTEARREGCLERATGRLMATIQSFKKGDQQEPLTKEKYSGKLAPPIQEVQ
jgi:hypothetical protein